MSFTERAPNFGRNLHSLVHNYLGRFWAIVKHCCANNEAMDNVFTACMVCTIFFVFTEHYSSISF